MRRVERYVIHGGVRGYERLKVIALAHRATTAALLDRLDLCPGMRCVDIGCGGGDVSFELAGRVGANGHVTGIDMDEVKLALAGETAAERGIANVDFDVGNVNEWNEPGAYDLVFSRLLLEHLSRPVDMLRRMWEAVAPGGAIAVEDADHEALFCYPPSEAYALYTDTFRETIRRHGGDPTFGRKLVSCFLEAGIPAPEITLTQRVDREGEVKTLPVLTLDAIAEIVIADGLALAETIASTRNELARLAADPATIIGGPRMFHAWARRTPD
jgi:ubiquinone/menaquinone biosynthesis C-methylase UbiE